MTALSLKAIVTEELGTLTQGQCKNNGPMRSVTWSKRLPGFGTRQYASGRKVYIVQTQMGGRKRTVTIGNAKVIGPALALDVARRVLLRAQVGENPADNKIETRKVPLFADFLDLYWQRMEPSWKPSTRSTHDTYRRLYLNDAFEGLFLDTIEPSDVQLWFNRITRISGPGGANRCSEIVRAAFNKAEEWGLRPEGSNPCHFLRTNRRRKCERFLSDQEIVRLGKVLEANAQAYPLQIAAIRLLMLTGCRKAEIENLTWREVKENRLKLTDSKTGPRIVWLGDAALAILKSLPRRPRQTFAFWDAAKGKRMSSIDGIWLKLRDEAGLYDLRIHDLRHSFASHAAARSETLPMIGKLLGHSDVTSTARYAHLDDGPVLGAAERVGGLIARAMGFENDLKREN